ncbi:transcription factor Adf-1-like [Schistocerca piceifrons]|uniref:transcription factor Adf-1-like n=1 Tax=Schistocerca piceifrons TaxID=274613 RepID=UPI001F5EF7A7|nr:transcription factor Adf-1-like [Schistocerca piceifrons]
MTIMEFDEYLIELVRSHSELYNMTDRRYNDSVWKETLWKEIGEEVGRPGPECKRRWVSLRDQFRKRVIKKTKSGQAAIPKKPWKYEEIMAFLRPYMLERETVSNITADICSEDESNDIAVAVSQLHGPSDAAPPTFAFMRVLASTPGARTFTVVQPFTLTAHAAATIVPRECAPASHSHHPIPRVMT